MANKKKKVFTFVALSAVNALLEKYDISTIFSKLASPRGSSGPLAVIARDTTSFQESTRKLAMKE